ncbi:hypothetical protein [Gramella sp. MAR_2010_147]|uniref:TlpA family protein disulfide reductase n=1 Tax=Gramella sp. MAR_2010_147 TaxID=1250205 RepID=UPI00087BB00A|nr:hypothetical protein [Gramella sp. MAR_2010_147]SDR66641.1 hypothetical protein SAMN04488553_0122 [Gramella sp. MAR_2010_147]
MKYLFFLSLCCVLLFTGCKDNSTEADSVFIGGQINNPETDYVVISRENRTIDTLYLDGKNQFGKDFKNLERGIYTFRHPPESQIIYTEPGDSIVIWLNTLSFDESLNFSGEGAGKSNFLLDMFLKNQSNNDLILTYYKIEPAKFAKITDSIKANRLQYLEELEDKNEFSDEFLKIARTSINYEFYDLRERYTFLIKKYYNNFAQNIPEDFHDYRSEINFSNEELQDYYLYTNLIDDFLRSRALEYCLSNHEDHKDCYNLNSYKNLESRILLIDSLSTLKPLKHEFLERFASQLIIMAETESRIDSILNLLKKIDYPNMERMKDLADLQRDYFVGTSLNSLQIRNTENEITTWGEVINKPTINYAWSMNAPARHRIQHKFVEELRKKYPEIDFMGINVDLDETEEWLRTLETYGYDKEKQFQITQREASNEVYKKYLYKVILLSAEGKILKGDLNIGSPDFEEKLLSYLNK